MSDLNLYDIKQGSSPKRPDRLWGLRSLLFNWPWGSFPGAERRGQDVEQKRPPSAAMPLLLFIRFMARTEKTLLFCRKIGLRGGLREK